METQFDGFVCISRDRKSFGFICFRTDRHSPVQLLCSQFAWPGTDEGRAAAQAQLVRVIERERLAEAVPAMRAYA